MRNRHSFDFSRRMLLGATLSAPFVRGAVAQTYPTRSPRIIVPFPAGGPADTLTRIAVERLSVQLGQQVVVENRGGAGGNIAADAAARAEADGYTMLVAGQAIVAINKALYKKLSYDPPTDFTFVGMLGVSPNLLLVNPNAVPVHSVAELIALAKKKPGEISYASNGPGSLTHLTAAILAKVAGIELLHVPYQGAAPLMTDLMTGRIGMTFTGASTALPLVQSGQLRAVAVTTAQRSQFSPDIPTLMESGFPTLNAPTWFGVMMRTATPAPIVARLRSEIAALTGREDYANALKKSFFEVMRVPPEDTDAYLAKERELWIEAVKVAGVAIE
jgi:tripartite-type tricarboxylate transporter receptor subunit TctC